MDDCLQVNVDPAVKLNISGIYAGNSFELAFKNYTDSTKAVTKDFVGTFSVIIAKDEYFTLPVSVIHEGANLIKSGNVLTFKMSKTENNLKHGTYHYQVINDVDTNKSFVEFRGIIPVNPSR